MAAIDELTIEDAAREAAGNWRTWTCFVWDRRREIDDPESWSLVYTHNRDSGLRDHSNAGFIARVLRPFSEIETPDLVFETHHHWAVGWVTGFSIRVYRDAQITKGFETYHGLMERLGAYSILDESDYSRREYEATIDNIGDAAWRIKSQYQLHDGWEAEVYEWLSTHRPAALENKDDRGGYPSEQDLQLACEALGCQRCTD
jgi:hypothetical protein